MPTSSSAARRRDVSSPTTRLTQWLRDLLDTSNPSGDSLSRTTVRSSEGTVLLLAVVADGVDLDDIPR